MTAPIIVALDFESDKQKKKEVFRAALSPQNTLRFALGCIACLAVVCGGIYEAMLFIG